MSITTRESEKTFRRSERISVVTGTGNRHQECVGNGFRIVILGYKSHKAAARKSFQIHSFIEWVNSETNSDCPSNFNGHDRIVYQNSARSAKFAGKF